MTKPYQRCHDKRKPDSLPHVMTETEPNVPKREEPAPRREDRISLRHDHDEWEEFDAEVKALGFRSRNAYISNVIGWVLHKPNARPPRRPPAKPDA